MKLAVTPGEAAKYREAQRLIGEVNAALKKRGELISFTVSAVRDDVRGGVPMSLTLVTNDAIPA